MRLWNRQQKRDSASELQEILAYLNSHQLIKEFIVTYDLKN